MIYAIGDIHGCARELELLLREISPQANDTVIFLGDYIDRGPDSKGVVDLILALKKRTQVVALKGNHEQLFIDFLESPESPGAGIFVLNGGAATLASYSGPGGSFEIPEAHMDFFYSLKTSYETPSHFFVHAGVPNKPLVDLTLKDESLLLWIREPFLSSDYEWSKTIVHGHTPVAQADIRENRINIDTGCVYNGFLTAMEIPTGRLIQIHRDVGPMRTPEEIAIDDHRIAVRFNGRMPVQIEATPEAHLEAPPEVPPEVLAGLHFETLNYNQFGLLMREIGPASLEPRLERGQNIQGSIGPTGPTAIQFEGVVARVESRNNVRLYGVSLTRVTNGNDGREWIERPPLVKS